MTDARSVPLQLTERSRRLLLDVIHMYLEGIEDAKKDTIQDNSLGSLENLLEVYVGYDEVVEDLNDIVKQLQEVDT